MLSWFAIGVAATAAIYACLGAAELAWGGRDGRGIDAGNKVLRSMAQYTSMGAVLGGGHGALPKLKTGHSALPRFGLQPEPMGMRDLRGALWLAVACAIGLLFAPVALLGRLVFGVCPLVPRSRVLVLMIRTLFRKPRQQARVKFRMTAFWLSRYALMPFWASCYYLDELVCAGRWLVGLGGWSAVVRPLFEISNRRSGSTDLGVKLASMEGIYAPCFAQEMYPFYWFWQLECALAWCGLLTPRRLSERDVAAWARTVTGREMKKMQQASPSKPGTFEVGTSMWTYVLGPVGLFQEGCGTGYGIQPPYAQEDLEQFLLFTDKLLRKCATFAPAGQRLMIKGHMIYAAEELAAMYQGSTFVCILREPLQQVKSSCNWLYVTRAQSLQRKRCGEGRWDEVIASACRFGWYWQAEADFYGASCARETASGTRKVVLRFDDYVSDSAAAIAEVLQAAGFQICREAVQDRLDSVTLGRAGKGEKEDYKFTCSLDELGIAHLPAIWCKGWCETFAHELGG